MTITLNKVDVAAFLGELGVTQELEKLKTEVIALRGTISQPVVNTAVDITVKETNRFSWKPWLPLLHATAKNSPSRRNLDVITNAMPEGVVTRSQIAAKLRNLGYIVDYKSGRIAE